MIIGAPLLWFLLGIGLIVAEFFLPGLVAGAIGLAALVAAGLAFIAPPIVQMLAWVVLSGTFVWWGRRLVPKTASILEESREARSQSAIPAGEKGRVFYEGSIWNAKCSVEGLDIPANRELYVVERRGNTLLVLPTHLLQN
ncbi:MAG: NfeD family protein [Cyanobacteria bacterium J06642_2]